MPDAVYLTTLLKFGLIGLSTFFSLNKLFQSIPNPLKLALSTSYALMSFHCQSVRDKTWLDIFILIPLIITGLHILITEKKFPLYFYKSVNLIYPKLLFWLYDSIVSYFLVSLSNFLGL